MRNTKFNEWQEMALKKDIETIAKKVGQQESLFFSLCWEVIITVSAILLDHWFGNSTFLWIAWIILALLPLVGLLLKKIFNWSSTLLSVLYKGFDTTKFVDLFDNKICYWSMICHSYSQVLLTMNTDKKSECFFIYQEACYYNNKCKQSLYDMYPVMRKIFFSDGIEAIRRHGIALYRLKNTLNIMEECQISLDKSMNDYKDDPMILEQKKINEYFEKNIQLFIKKMNTCFNDVSNS